MNIFSDATWKKEPDTSASVYAEIERIKAILVANDSQDIVKQACDWIQIRRTNQQASIVTPGTWVWPAWWQRLAYTHLLPLVSVKALKGQHIEGIGDLLFNIGGCAEAEGYTCISERYMLLALLSDLMHNPEAKLPTFSGAYMHLLKRGLTDSQVEDIRAFVKKHPKQKLPEVLFAKALVIAITLCRTPSEKELLITEVNQTVATYLYEAAVNAKSKNEKGTTLEEFVEYSLSAINGFIPKLRAKDNTKEYDIICEITGDQQSFRKEIGRHIMGEAKNTKAAPSTHVAHRLDSLLDSSTIKLGLIISKQPCTRAMKLELTRIRNKQRHIIVYFTLEEIYEELSIGNFLDLIKTRFDDSKLNLGWI